MNDLAILSWHTLQNQQPERIKQCADKVKGNFVKTGIWRKGGDQQKEGGWEGRVNQSGTDMAVPVGAAAFEAEI